MIEVSVSGEVCLYSTFLPVLHKCEGRKNVMCRLLLLPTYLQLLIWDCSEYYSL